MRRGTTPTVVLTVTNEDGSPCDLTGQDIHITFKEAGTGGYMLDKRGTDPGVTVSKEGDATEVEVSFTQAETLSFHSGRTVRAQVRCKDSRGMAQATDIASFVADEILFEGEI